MLLFYLFISQHRRKGVFVWGPDGLFGVGVGDGGAGGRNPFLPNFPYGFKDFSKFFLGGTGAYSGIPCQF